MMDTAEVRWASDQSVSAADRVYEYAKAGILERRFGSHDLLTEGELAAAVGVSRTPVREALLRLQGDGLIRLLPKRGALVLPVTADEIADVLETRRHDRDVRDPQGGRTPPARDWSSGSTSTSTGCVPRLRVATPRATTSKPIATSMTRSSRRPATTS